MARPPLPVGSHGAISKTAVERIRVSPAGAAPKYRDVHLSTVGGKHYRPDDTKRGEAIKPTGFVARCRFRDYDGQTRKVEAWGDSAAAAERALRAVLVERSMPTSEELGADAKVEVLLRLWLAELDASGLAEGTRVRYRAVAASYIKPTIGGLLLREVRVSRLNNLIRVTAEKHGKSSGRMTRTVLIAMWDHAVNNDAARDNLAAKTQAVAAGAKEVRALGAADIQQLRRQLRADRTAVRGDVPDVIDVMIGTGARIGEVLALLWSDVELDTDRPTLAITGTVVRVAGGLTRQTHLKTKTSRRELLIPDFLAALLRERWDSTVEMNPHGVVFPSAVGTLRDPCGFRNQWRAVRSRLGLEWVVPHTFRKSVATALAAASNSKLAADQLGHRGTQVTDRHYIERTHKGPDARALLEQLGRVG